MSSLKYRLVVILALIVSSAWALFPRDVTVRQRRPDGTFYDTVQRRVPLRKGLDLQGGMHLTLEVDESKRAVSDKADAIDRALKVVRSRIEGFGVSEPVIQKAGSDRIIVELPGIDDRERAINVVQEQAFLEFQIVDESHVLERALPRIDAIVREKGGAAQRGAAKTGTGLEGLLTSADSAKGAKSTSSKAKGDTSIVPSGGPVSK